jgi:pimeloyl-ACP methyl ester carboxylesterase
MTRPTLAAEPALAAGLAPGLAAALALGAAAAATGGAALAVAARARARERAAEAAYPPTGTLVDAEGLRVHAHVEGAGPDLVLIHGANGNTRDFTFRLIPLLRGRYRVTAFDRPGLGWSQDAGPAGTDPRVQARILRAAAARLGLRRPIVLGQSYGGAVAMAWALQDPQTAAAVLVAGATMPWEGGLGLWYRLPASRFGGAVVVPLAVALAPYSGAEPVLRAIFAPDPVPQGYGAHVGTPLVLRRAPLRTNSRQVNGLKPHLVAMAADYPRLTLPVEIVHGDRDTIVPAATHALPLAACIPGAAVDIIPGAGHMPHHSHAARVIAAIDRARLRTGA